MFTEATVVEVVDPVATNKIRSPTNKMDDLTTPEKSFVWTFVATIIYDYCQI